MSKRRQSQHQKQMRRRRREKAFLFDAALTRPLTEIERDDWEFAVDLAGGGVAEAARVLGIADIPPSAKALWGRTPQGAVETYRAWQNRKAKKRGRK